MKRSLVIILVLLGAAAVHAQTPVPELKADADVNFLKLPPDLQAATLKNFAHKFGWVSTAKEVIAELESGRPR